MNKYVYSLIDLNKKYTKKREKGSVCDDMFLAKQI